MLPPMIMCLAATPGGKVAFREDFESGSISQWNKVEFEGETRHALIRSGTNNFLRATANRSASGLAVKLDGVPAQNATFSWRWQIDKIPPGASDDVKKTFDHTARIFVAFKTLVGPPKTINYVWANKRQVGESFHHPSSGRSRFVVLQTGNAKAGQWISESRDLAADWKELFGDDDPPVIVGLGFMSDSDGTGTVVTGAYDDIQLKIEK
jgi:hypothetical protein